MKQFLLLPALLLSLTGMAQTAVRIVNPQALVLRPDLATDSAAQAGMQAAGLTDEVKARAIYAGEPERWPVGLRTDSARSANAAAMQNYVAYLVCEYPTAEGALTLVFLPATGNFHMPDELRSVDDIHLVFRSGGVEVINNAGIRTAASAGPAWRNLRNAKIIKPDDIFATYDLSDDPEGLEALEKMGLSKPEVEAVIFRSHERNWPEGIALFDKRYPKLALFKKYKAYRLARWADKVLVVIPADANKKADLDVRPYLDIYMVFTATAVKVKEKK